MKHFKVIIKFVMFFIGWAIFAGLIDFPQDNMALWRLGAELVPLLFIILFSVVFWIIDKKKNKNCRNSQSNKNISYRKYNWDYLVNNTCDVFINNKKYNF